MGEHASMNPVRAVLLDLDDTLIVEESHARAQIRGTAPMADVDPDAWERIVIDTARAAWHASEYHPACKDLGIASWEGLWATFAGAHPRIAPLRDFVDTYRQHVWTTSLKVAGSDPSLASELSHRYVEGQRSGHPLAPGAAGGG